MIKTFRYRLYPTRRQEDSLVSTLNICAELYNAALQERRDAWRLQRKSISYVDQTLQLTQIKAVRQDVASVNANALENVLKRVDRAFKNFFRRSNAGYPRFRSARTYNSVTFRQIGKVAIKSNRLYLSKIGNVKIKLHRPLLGMVKTLTVKRDAGRWFAAFTVECEARPLPFSPNVVGIDVGLQSFAVLSDGAKIENPRYFCQAQAKLRRVQRRVARRKQGSNRRRKAVALLGKLYAYVRGQRRDFHHRETRKLINNHGLIAVENLNVKGLARSWLSKSVHDAGWSTFFSMLAYKAEEAGRVFVKVDPRGTSQMCICGAVVRKTLNERIHNCESCGLVADRDHVSARIILERAVPSGVNVGVLMPCVA